VSDDQLQRHTPRRKTVLLPVVGLLALAACGMALLGLSTARVGVEAELVGIAAALVPVGPVVAAFLWIDRWEPEPARLLWLAFGWGACVAAITALLINNTAEAVGDLLLGKGNGDTLSALVSAPLVEEFMKGAFVYGIFLFLRHEFDGVIDGIVYAGFVAAGFAFTENIYYFGRAFAEYGIGDGTTPGVITAFILRGVLSPFTHPLFTACIGVGIGIAARSHKHRVLAPALGFVAAVVLHAAWNGAATLGGGTGFLTVYFLVMVPLFAGAVWFITWHRKREQRIIAAALPGMVADNLILDNEVEALASLEARRKWRKRVRVRTGRDAAALMAEYHAAVSELAFLRHAAAEGMTGKHDLTDEAHLVAVVRATRHAAVRASAR
jgi:RsiW-degrading membrane proteinase PrsW (M82 family)